MLGITILGSGSGGNCSLISTDQCRILVDCGFSARQIELRLRSVNVEPETLNGILLTHEHGDHTAGIEVFCKKFKTPIFTNALTAIATGLNHDKWNLFESGASFDISDIAIQTFYVPHDAADPVAFVFTSGDQSIGYLTDLGYAPRLALERIKTVHTLFLESNHDERLLREDTKRSWPTKQRVLSRHGHLSNTSAARLASAIPDLKQLILGHLSQDCNRPELVFQAMLREGITAPIYCAEQDAVSPQFIVNNANAPSTAPTQIALMLGEPP